LNESDFETEVMDKKPKPGQKPVQKKPETKVDVNNRRSKSNNFVSDKAGSQRESETMTDQEDDKKAKKKDGTAGGKQIAGNITNIINNNNINNFIINDAKPGFIMQ